jgi:glycine hydroxymethyltransferase
LAPDFKEYSEQVLKNAQAMVKVFNQAPETRVVSGATDNHLLLIEVTGFELTGREAEELLDSVHITVNKNSIPFESKSFKETSGVRIGTPAITSRGFLEEDAKQVAELIIETLRSNGDEEKLLEIRQAVLELTESHPIQSH